MNGIEHPVIVGFPLRGEWMAPNTPGSRIPSHGTDLMGERYAYDFVMVNFNRPGKPFYRASPARYLLLGVPLSNCYGWGQKVYAPCDGEIVMAEDGLKERQTVHVASDWLAALSNTRSIRRGTGGFGSVAGNFVMMKCADQVYAAFAHLKAGSVAVKAGQAVRKGDVLGEVGHTGNSFAPHLHFQLMDSSDVMSAKGIPCAFEQYEVFRGGKWETVHNGIPSAQDRFRFIGNTDK